MGPWYEENGPDAKCVRKKVSELMKPLYPTLSSSYMNKVILNHIPDGRCDFGSWRGLASFGLDKDMMNIIKSDLNDGVKAFQKLEKYLLPYIQHHLYKPGGIRMLATSKTTMVGKKD